ncbi:MAG: heme utilization protein, partial [Burkholderiaceae bacterium]|nr:heme utilization protein [Burkholderiaceae bacterium]
MTTLQVSGLTTQQLSASFGTRQVAALQSAHIAAFSSTQFRALPSDAISALNTSSLQGLRTNMLAALTAQQLGGMTLEQVAALATWQIGALSAEAWTGLTPDQIAALTVAQAQSLRFKHLFALAVNGTLGALETQDVAVLATSELAQLAPFHLNLLTEEQITAMTTLQFRALSSTALTGFSGSQIAAIETRDLAVLPLANFRQFDEEQMASLTLDQIAALRSDQVCVLNPRQVLSLTAAQISAFKQPFYTPVVLDLDGNGIDTVGVDAGVRFDMQADGYPVATGWVGGKDGLLTLDRNGDGAITSGAELFGASTPLQGGGQAANGYQAMADLDSNADGALTAADSAWQQLRVWTDNNGDGVSEASELHTLASLKIARIGLDARATLASSNGNIVGLMSSYLLEDGTRRDSADVWFAGRAQELPQAGLATGVASLARALAEYAHSLPAPGTAAQSDAETLRLRALQSDAAAGWLAAPK